MSADREKFAELGRPRTIWAVSAIHADANRLAVLHQHLAAAFKAGDRVVYLGNLIGRGSAEQETVAELLAFRREMMAMPGVLPGDLVYLRGAQEEMWQKLLQIQFAPNPQDVLRWMLDEGVEPTLKAYGGKPETGLAAAREGAIQLTRWTNELRAAMRDAPGHNNLFAALRRAAFTQDGAVLFVSAGIDPARPLPTQGDSFWWGSAQFNDLTEPYFGCGKVIRGFDPANGGVFIGDVTATLDSGCGRGGGLTAARIRADGQIMELVQV